MAMFFTDPQLYATEGVVIGEQLEQAPLTCARLEPTHIAGSRILRVTSACRRKIFGENWLAVGDSASSYDPLSGRGILKALRHGAGAARAIAEGSFESYAALVRREFQDYVRQRRTFYADEQRWPGSNFWSRRAREVNSAPKNTL